MDKKFEYKENTGSLWHETNCTVVRKGKIKIEGIERYACILKNSQPDKPDKFEIAISAGLLKKVTDEERADSEKPDLMPDIKGLITFNTKKYELGGWRNVTGNGAEYTKVKLKEANLLSDEKKTYKKETETDF